MSSLRDIGGLYKQERLADFMPYLCYSEEHNLYYNSDSTLGFMLEITPVMGMGDQLAGGISSLLEQDWPEETLIQFMLYADPNMTGVIDRYVNLRTGALVDTNPRERFLLQWTDWQGRFLREHRKKGISSSVPVPFRNFRAFVTIKIPFAGAEITAANKTVAHLNIARDNLMGMFRSNHIGARNCTPEVLVQLLWQIWNPNHPFIHKSSAWDRRQLLRHQIIAFDTEICQRKDHVLIDKYRVKVKIPQQYPMQVAPHITNLLIGSPFGQNQQQICCPFLLTFNIDPTPADQNIALKSEITGVQNSALRAMAPKLRRKNEEFSWAASLCEQGGKFIRGYYTLLLFSNLPEDEEADPANRGFSLAQHEAATLSWWEAQSFRLQDELFCALPYMIAALPFGLYKHALRNMDRCITAPADSFAYMVPIQADWRGTNNEVMLYLTRRGQICSLDFFTSDTNYNFAVAAPSGSGKSFLVNKILQEHSSRGGLCYVVDIGRSYRKQCELQMGQYIEFDNSREMSVNVFGELTAEMFKADLYEAEESEDSFDTAAMAQKREEARSSLLVLYTQILAVMANPKEKISDFETSLLSNAIRDAYGALAPGEIMVVDRFVEVLEARQQGFDQDGKQEHTCGKLAERLKRYCEGGEYGKWFRGKMNVDFEKPFVVLELEELNDLLELREVILLLLISIIERKFYRGDRSIPKIVLFDEAWDLFRNPNTASFIETAYRRMRKYRGSIGTIVQSFLDFIDKGDSSVGQAIMSNSEWKMALQPKGEELRRCVEKHILNLNDSDLKMADHVHTDRGVYSEVFLFSSKTTSVFRFIPTPAEKVAFTTNPEEVQVYDNISKVIMAEQGGNPLDTIALCAYAYELMEGGMSPREAESSALGNRQEAIAHSMRRFESTSESDLKLYTNV